MAGIKDPTPDTPAYIVEWFRRKTPAELDAIEHGGRLLWPETLKTKGVGGKVREVLCMLRVPTILELTQAIIAANEKVAELANVPRDKRPITRLQAEEYLKPAGYGMIHTSMIMAYAIREIDPPHAQMFAPSLIIDAACTNSLYELYDRLDVYQRYEDVRMGDELTEEAFRTLVIQVAEVASVYPLAACDVSVRHQVIVRMAQHLVETPPFSSASPATSTSDS